MLMFVDLVSYNKVKEMDKVNIHCLESFATRKHLTLVDRHVDGLKDAFNFMSACLTLTFFLCRILHWHTHSMKDRLAGVRQALHSTW
jgi:hypothetical protein